MIIGGSSLYLNLGFIRRLLLLIFTITILDPPGLSAVSAACDFSFRQNNKLYTYDLTSPISNFPHGILSEDGFYKVAANGTVIWFQLCDTMIFNHDPPICADCMSCGGSSRCGMGCSALASSIIDGYPVCITLGDSSTTSIDIIDNKNPLKGIVAKMYNNGLKTNCSLAVSVVCDAKGLDGPQTLKKVSTCDFATELRHPSGCGRVVSSNGGGLGWFGTLMITILCLFGVYLVAGMIYRYFFLHIRGIDIIPNLEFWTSLPNRVQSLFVSVVRRFRGTSQRHRSTYSHVDF